MNHNQWSVKPRIEERYRRALQNLIDRFVMMLPGLNLLNPYEIVSEFSRYFASDLFQEFAQAAASRMITGLLVDSGHTWREAAKESGQGRTIYEALRNELQGPMGHKVQLLIDQNAFLIKSLPQDITVDVTRHITREAQMGRRHEDIARDLEKKFPDMARYRITRIARTETSKASTDLIRARSEIMDLPWYVWRTSKDSRVRESHRILDRVLIRWDDPPAPEALARIKSSLGNYHAGKSPNCRCYPEPLIRMDQVKWPCKAYSNDSIRYMTRFNFEQMNGGLRHAA